MADETRNVDVALRISKEGDAGAFKDAAEEVRDLGTAAGEVGGALEDESSAASSLSDSVADAAEKVGEL
ncbi:MAG: hypothetical protein K8H90_07840, partial [Thermoanaerobaculia bacterium]|nr:hypothetical protein [Thermoanaerobaculia bacterium]